MYNNLKALQGNIERHILAITQSYSYNHPSIIIILTLVTVIAWQNFSDKLPTIELVSPLYAYNDKQVNQSCDYKCLTREWVDLRTTQIMAEDLESFRLQSRYKALTEANEMITSI